MKRRDLVSARHDLLVPIRATLFERESHTLASRPEVTGRKIRSPEFQSDKALFCRHDESAGRVLRSA
jgi:hypothetical protein